MTRVLILWADSRSANLGVRALAHGMETLALETWGEGSTVDFQDFGPGDSDIGFGGRTIIRDLPRLGRGPICKKLEEYDIILDSGAGDSFADIYGLKRFTTMHYAHRAARRVGTPFVLAPQTVGPFGTFLGRAMARSSLRMADQVFARDPLSLDYAAGLGVAAHLSTDVVFTLPAPPPADARDVILNVSGLLWSTNAHGDPALYRRNVVKMIQELHVRGRRVSLLAHVLDNPTDDNDVRAVREVAALLDEPIEVIVPRDLHDVRSVLASSELVIGARMHACLNALSTGTPAIPWAYSRKFAPLMEDLGWSQTVEAADANVVESTLRATLDGQLRGKAGAVGARARSRLDESVELLRSVQVSRNGVGRWV